MKPDYQELFFELTANSEKPEQVHEIFRQISNRILMTIGDDAEAAEELNKLQLITLLRIKTIKYD